MISAEVLGQQSVSVSIPAPAPVTLTVQDQAAIVTEAAAAPIVAYPQVDDSAQLVAAYVPGPKGATGDTGPQGLPGSVSGIGSRIAGIVISGHRVVTPQVDGSIIYASADDVSFATRPLFLAVGSAQVGNDVAIVIEGDVIEPSWSWTPNEPIFLGLDGALTQIAPSAPTFAFMAFVGYATSATSLYFKPQPPIVLAA